MKSKWNDEEIKNLFELIEHDQTKNISTLESFRKFATQTNRNALSVRNFYYQYVKYLNKTPEKATQLGINLKNHVIQNFKHFDKEEEASLHEKITELLNKGYSIRKACESVSNGTISDMLRIQNKFRSLQKKQTAKVIQFPKTQKQSNAKLSDDDIKSLFMGLVKLVKENAQQDSKEEFKNYVKQYEKHKLKDIVTLQQKEIEIQILKKQILDLKQKNKNLNDKLTNYRIEMLSTKNIKLFDNN